MRKFASIVLFFGMLSILLLGGGRGVAQAGTVDYKCNYVVGVNVISCQGVIADVQIEIKVNRVLTANEISKVEYALADTPVNHEKIKEKIVTIFKSFNPTVTIIELKICIQGVCQWYYYPS